MSQSADKVSPAGQGRTHRELGKSLRDVPGFTQGRQLRSKVLNLGEQIRQLRENELKITQTKAAKLIGIDQSELSRIESGLGRRGPSFLTISRIIEAYQAYLQEQDPSYHLGLGIVLSRANTGDAEHSMIAGS